MCIYLFTRIYVADLTLVNTQLTLYRLCDGEVQGQKRQPSVREIDAGTNIVQSVSNHSRPKPQQS